MIYNSPFSCKYVLVEQQLPSKKKNNKPQIKVVFFIAILISFIYDYENRKYKTDKVGIIGLLEEISCIITLLKENKRRIFKKIGDENGILNFHSRHRFINSVQSESDNFYIQFFQSFKILFRYRAVRNNRMSKRYGSQAGKSTDTYL